MKTNSLNHITKNHRNEKDNTEPLWLPKLFPLWMMAHLLKFSEIEFIKVTFKESCKL